MSKRDAAFVSGARDQLAMTQADLAKELDVNRRTIIRWESGDDPLPRVARLAILHLLETRKPAP